MPGVIPISKTAGALVREFLRQQAAEAHPGLLLDKFPDSWDPQPSAEKTQQRIQKPTLENVAAARGQTADVDFVDLCARHRHALRTSAATTSAEILLTTTSPLALHLSRASALENAGICLHPIYGFAYFPGTGVKGVARAYAETVWLAGRPAPSRAAAWATIEAVFGWAPHSDELAPGYEKPWKPSDALKHGEDDAESGGAIVFHDAWPVQWPLLTVDILNSHHAGYYEGKDAPGDWENPRPVYFPIISPGQAFSFAIAARRDDVPAALLALAREWLEMGMTGLAFGAKTNSGYGCLQPVGATAVIGDSACRNTLRLELVTAAFLAGADHKRPEGCKLRPATLRGQLRWWWRTMHAGYVSVDELRLLEAAIWGDTAAGGVVRISLIADGGPAAWGNAILFEKNQVSDGLRYLAYGMDEKSRGERRQRWCLLPGAAWRLTVEVRATRYFADRKHARKPDEKFPGLPIAAEAVSQQALAAVWLLCTFGGVGSKARKGFGSLQAADAAMRDWDLDRCKTVAAQLRDSLGFTSPFRAEHALSAAVGDAVGPLAIAVQSTDSADALDRVGMELLSFAADQKHNPTKAALGLPRKIHGPNPAKRHPDDHRGGPLGHQDPATWQPATWLLLDGRSSPDPIDEQRHASPVHIHLSQDLPGEFTARIIAFPSHRLPDRLRCRALLKELMLHLEKLLGGTRSKPTINTSAPSTPAPQRPAKRTGTTGGGGARLAPTAGGSAKRPFGTPVQVTLLAKREGGGYDVQEHAKPQGILKLGVEPDPPPPLNSSVSVFIKDDGRPPQYQWGSPPPPKARFGPKPQKRSY